MDFGEVLQTAKQNGSSKPRIQYYSTKFAPPKKEQRNKTVSVNVQKFLARKEAEEKQKLDEARKQREKLLALRSQDKKATRRVNVMLKRTKSASQAVIEDARDADNTAVTLVGPSQPDEDDYGYVSKESEALYNKMMEKYSKMPEESKFNMQKRKVSTNLNSTKEKVMAALEREQLEASMPHRRKRKHVAEEVVEKEESSPVYEEEKEKKKEPQKPKFKAAPPVNFDDLLKLAAKKQHEPIIIETKKVEEERLFTKRQKKEYEREKEWRDRKESRGKPVPDNRIPMKTQKSNEATPSNDGRIPKKTNNKVPDLKPDLPSNSVKNSSGNVDRNSNIPNTSKEKRVEKVPQQKSSDKDVRRNSSPFKKPDVPSLNKITDYNHVTSTSNSINKNKISEKRDKNDFRASDDRRLNPGMANGRPNSVPNGKPRDLPPNNSQKRPLDVKPKTPDAKLKEFPPKNLNPRQLAPTDLKPKQFSSPDVRRKEFPSKDVKRKPLVANKRRIIDDDDEEEQDSEMDDFIDDGPEEEQDYSNIIGQIFGYDKRRYKSIDDEDSYNMESSFAQQMREECISTKIGIKEDLEDMQREEEEKRQKALRLKKQRKL